MLAERIRDDELSRLRRHVLDCHPDEMHNLSPGIEATLRHYRVEPEPGPPDIAGWPEAAACPGLPQIRTCGTTAYGSSEQGLAPSRNTPSRTR